MATLVAAGEESLDIVDAHGLLALAVANHRLFALDVKIPGPFSSGILRSRRGQMRSVRSTGFHGYSSGLMFRFQNTYNPDLCARNRGILDGDGSCAFGERKQN
jgi:hypothetical protein